MIPIHGLLSLGGYECEGGVILGVAHPDQMRRDRSSRQLGEDAGPVGNRSLQWDYLKGLFKQTVESSARSVPSF